MPDSYFIGDKQYSPSNTFPNAGTPEHNFNQFLTSILPSNNHPLEAASAHHFSAPGKQLRAKLALSAGDKFGADSTSCIHWATAVELLHNASLIHDDICDGDSIRRNKASVWSKYGRDIAIALGDWMIAEAFEQAAKASHLSGSFGLVSKLSTHMKSTVAGQSLEFERTAYPDIDKYLLISAGKTAPLFVAAIDGVAEIAGRIDLIETVSPYFVAMGVCYQYANDIQNILGTDGAASPSSDLKRRAPNAVIVYFRSALKPEKRAQFDSWLAGKSQTKANYWQKKLIKSGAILTAAEEMNKVLTEAEGVSGTLPKECVRVISPIQKQLNHVCKQVGSACP